MNPGRDRAWIASHLPHRGTMCLLDEIVAWDDEHLQARAVGHRRADHPLRRAGMLPIASAIEYGAQAVAAHGALMAGSAPPRAAGYLAAARSVRFGAERLDDVDQPLDIRVERVGGGAAGVIYGFVVAAGERELASGRVTIVLDADAVRGPP